ncbi:hypothetical protein ACFL27_10420 [candidate division CSSED10-310 bacterium]|uniref:DUF4386 domain-containing protein n=1 Tax=candidate division CSSED10-310 bacterium TaxID=2855610 RepID=A0ABV6YWL4_UNCC1
MVDLKKRPFGRVGIIGITVVLVSLILVLVFPTKAPGIMDGFITPIIAFEFIETRQEVFQLFGPRNSPVQSEMVSRMNLGNYLDFVYMLLYSLFLAALSLKCARQAGNKIFYAGVPLSVFVLGGDFLENLQLLGITSKLQTGNFESELYYLHIFTWQKWGGIALIFVLLGPYFMSGNLYSKLIALGGFFTFILACLAFLQRSVLNEIFGLAVVIMFLMLIIYCFTYKKDDAADR